MVWEISVYVHHVNCMRIINQMDVLIVLLYIYMNHEKCRISAKLTKALTSLFCYIAIYFQQTFSLYNKSTSALLRFWKRPGLTFPNFILDYKLLYCGGNEKWSPHSWADCIYQVQQISFSFLLKVGQGLINKNRY